MKQSGTIRFVIATVTLAATIAIGAADVSGYLPEITVFALIPVIAGTYYLGFGYGFFLAVTAAVSELTAHVFLEAGPHSQIIANTLSHTFIYILTAALIDRLVGQLRIITGLEEQRSADLDIAKKVHGSVFSPVPGSHGNLSIGNRVAFARELGGDYYHFTDLDERLFICIADISGKSMSAALFTALLNQSVTEALEHTHDLTALVERVSSNMSSTLPEELFVTMFCALMDEGKLDYVNAGHPPPLLYSSLAAGVKTLESKYALPIGIKPDLRIETRTEPFGPGDILLVTTDGVIESYAFRDHPYEKLKDLLFRNAAADAQAIADAVFGKAVPGGTKALLDDITVACIKRLA